MMLSIYISDYLLTLSSSGVALIAKFCYFIANYICFYIFTTLFGLLGALKVGLVIVDPVINFSF